MSASFRGATSALLLALGRAASAAESTPIDEPGAYPPGTYRFPCDVRGDDPMFPKAPGTKGEIVTVESSFVKRPGDLPSIHSAGTPPECRPVELTPGTYHIAVQSRKVTWVWAKVMGTAKQADSKVTSSISYLTVTVGSPPPKGRCHRDYVAQLRRDLDQLKKMSDAYSEQLAEILDNPKFQKAADEIAIDTGMLAFETAKAIVSAGGAGAAGTKLEHGAEVLAGLLEAADGLLKALEGKDVEFGVDRALQKAKAKTAAAIKDLFSAVEAANKFGDDLARLIETADAVAHAEELQAANTRLFKEVVDKLNRCKGEPGQEPARGPGPKRPRGPKPPKGPSPPEPEGGPEEPGGAGEPEGGAEPPGGEAPPPPPRPPEPPKPPPQRPGLPLPPDEKERVQKLLVGRGCGGMGVRIEARDASSAAAGLRDLEKAMMGFRDGPLARFRGELGRLEGAIQRAESTSRVPEAQRRRALGFLVPELNGIVPEARSFGKEGDAFLGVVGGCDRSFPPMIDAVRASATASNR